MLAESVMLDAAVVVTFISWTSLLPVANGVGKVLHATAIPTVSEYTYG